MIRHDFVAGCALALACGAASTAEASGLAVQTVADQLLSASGSPGAAVARACPDGRDIAVAGLRKLRGQAPIAETDLWHMGSNTKAMTATLAARLVERGVLDWSDTVSDILGGLGLVIDPDLADATLEDLLSHRSGLRANAGLGAILSLMGADAERDVAADRLAYAASVLSAEPAGPRGAFLYSNAGYVVAGLMLETAAGEPYEALMAREVFAPLGMESAGWGPPGLAGTEDQPRGHRAGWFGVSVREPGPSADNPPALNSAGRAHMALDDLLDFLDAHAARPEAYLSAASWDRLHTPVAGGDYALGWGVEADGALSHAGSNTMWFVQMRIEPGETGCRMAAAVNDGRIDQVSGPVSAALRALSGR